MCFLLMIAENRCVWVYVGLCLKTIKETGAMAGEKRKHVGPNFTLSTKASSLQFCTTEI